MISFRLFKIDIHIKFMFVALITIFLLVDKTGISVIALSCCLIHEIGHIFMFFLVGYRPVSLTFDLTGICLTKPLIKLSYLKEFLVQIAGSLTNFLVFVFLCKTVNQITYTSIFATTHLVVGIFNLLPLKTFDGGKILEMTLLQFFSINTSQKICTFIDFLCILILLIISMFGFFYDKRSFTLVVITIYLMITALIKLNQD